LALDNAYQKRRDGQEQQNVNEPAKGIRTGDSQKPQEKKDHTNCPEHFDPTFLFASAGLKPRRSGESGWTHLRNCSLALLHECILAGFGALICSFVHTSEPFAQAI
jgi:hypothetical protein